MNSPPECKNRPFIPEIKDVILDEERKALSLISRVEKDVLRVVKKRGMIGETLAMLYHTYGHDLEIVGSIVDIPEEIMEEFYIEMEKERMRSKEAHVKQPVILAKNVIE